MDVSVFHGEKTNLQCSSKYSIDYMRQIVKVVKGAVNKCTLGWGNDMPLRVSFHNQDMNGMYLLAPRIGDD